MLSSTKWFRTSCVIKMKALSKYFEQERNNPVEKAQTTAVQFCQHNKISTERRVHIQYMCYNNRIDIKIFNIYSIILIYLPFLIQLKLLVSRPVCSIVS